MKNVSKETLSLHGDDASLSIRVVAVHVAWFFFAHALFGHARAHTELRYVQPFSAAEFFCCRALINMIVLL